MATLSLTVPDAVVPRVLDALKAEFPDLADAALTDAQIGRRGIVRLLRACLYRHETTAARVQAQADFDSAVATATQDLDSAANSIT